MYYVERLIKECEDMLDSEKISMENKILTILGNPFYDKYLTTKRYKYLAKSDLDKIDKYLEEMSKYSLKIIKILTEFELAKMDPE